MSGCGCEGEEVAALERRTLAVLLAINAAMFVVEVVAGRIGQSTGLTADSLDMLADAGVYGIALYAAGRADKQSGAARLSGMLQIALGLGVLLEVARRYLYGSEPASVLMMSVGAAALVANVACLMLISKHREGGAHMRASRIFSTNDVIANLGVIASGGLVRLLGSRLPDLIIGALIAAIVIRGGMRILRETKAVHISNEHTTGAPFRQRGPGNEDPP